MLVGLAEFPDLLQAGWDSIRLLEEKERSRLCHEELACLLAGLLVSLTELSAEPFERCDRLHTTILYLQERYKGRLAAIFPQSKRTCLPESISTQSHLNI